MKKLQIKLNAFESLDSTNTYLKKLAAEGASEGTVVIANAQTAGRGRMGRGFASAQGLGIYMSLLLRPDLRKMLLVKPTRLESAVPNIASRSSTP